MSSAYKLEIFSTPPQGFQGKLFSFSPLEGTCFIDISQDPFHAIQEAARAAIGNPCGLVSSGFCFFSELFVSVYEHLTLSFLETKNYMKDQTLGFLGKKERMFSLLEFSNTAQIPVILIGKGRSLLEDVEKLKSLQNKAFLVSCYSALPFLKDYGITCDLAFATDPQQPFHGALNTKHLLVSAKTHVDILKGFERVSLFSETHCEFSNFLFQDRIQAPVYGYTICDLALKYLLQKGFSRFYLTGVDLEETCGMYADLTPCGFKPDFKKAKEHLEALIAQGVSIKPLKEFSETSFDEPLIQAASFDPSPYIISFQNSLEKLKKLDFQTLGLYEMFELEQEPFYRVVLEPLYETVKGFKNLEEQDKRSFFQEVMKFYQN
jgi:hypothetical protein